MNAQNDDQEKDVRAEEEPQLVGPALPPESPEPSEADELPKAPQGQVEEPKEEKPEQVSKARRFFRRTIRWALGVMIVFGLGFLTAIFSLYHPEAVKYQQASKRLNQSQEEIATLEARVEELLPLETKNKNLLATQADYELHIALLDARVDIANARLALAEDETAQAQLALKNTDETLATIKAGLPAAQSEVVSAMEDRLKLTLSETENDPYAAQSDLDVLATNLLQLEDSLFGSP